jgi:putative Ca2+/H+ antiporter (TMEM165/GDT1 family)
MSLAQFPFVISLLAAATGELGDKSQILVLMLAGYFDKTAPVMAGSVLASLANNTVSVLAGNYFRNTLGQRWSRPLVATMFFTLALWAFKHDTAVQMPLAAKSYGPLLATFLLYFLADLGDKTQLATVALAASYDAPLALISGSTLGSLAIDAPSILLVRANARAARLEWTHYVFAGMFAVLGLVTLLNLPRQRLSRLAQLKLLLTLPKDSDDTH